MMITILMAAYNGEKYIAEQINSILKQTETGWKLIIQDDCSADNTYKIAQKYSNRYPQKIEILRRKSRSGSAKNNISSMLSLSNSEYMMMCDQDDIWLPSKIKLTLQKMYELEKIYGETTPILVHSDLKIVNDKMKVISNSLFQHENLNCNKNKLNNLLAQNIVTGCTMMVNQALLKMVDKIPDQALMHDRWFALVAAAFGKIGFIDEPTVLYRQHNNNVVGAKNTRSFFYNLNRMLQIKQSKQVLTNSYIQAEAFLAKYGDMLPHHLIKIVKAYASIPKYGKMNRIRIIHHYDFWKTGIGRKCGQVLFS